ncbi:hypothetical protein BASA81_002998 [Batrachochytrium salamandrivorans]|nr:hypothetical protein BASA81_002998 [Batrachochytrium salamandrivorans]
MMNRSRPINIAPSNRACVVRDPASQRTILDVVHASHRITVHALQFLKLYLLSCFENGVKLPLVTEHLVVSIMNVLCEESEHQETRATSTSSPTPCRQTGSRARCCGTRRAPEKKKRLARKRELLALPKDLKRVRPEPSAKRAELYVAPTGSSKRVVGVDPGKSDLISSGTGPGDWFRYTQKRHETGEKKHRRARTRMARTLVEGKTVVEWELSTFSRKALTVSAAEAWGDWSRGSQMKFLEPTKGVGMRKLFSRAGYEVVLVDEFRTSCTCFACEGGACEKFRVVENPRPWMRAKRPMVLRHGLLRCKTCERLWNRDRNGSLNIMRCAQAARLGGQRPSYMTRNFSAARPAGTTQGAGLPTMFI